METKIKNAVRAGKLDRAPGDALIQNALQAGIISNEEMAIIETADEARNEAIQVDSFDPEEFMQLKG